MVSKQTAIIEKTEDGYEVVDVVPAKTVGIGSITPVPKTKGEIGPLPPGIFRSSVGNLYKQVVVPSFSSKGTVYLVKVYLEPGLGVWCDCPACKFSKKSVTESRCKHIEYVKNLFGQSTSVLTVSYTTVV